MRLLVLVLLLVLVVGVDGLGSPPPVMAVRKAECSGFFEYCNPYVVVGQPFAIISTSPGTLDDHEIGAGNHIAGVLLFSFASELSTWLLPSTIGLLTSCFVWNSQGGIRGTLPTQFGQMQSLANFVIRSSSFLTGTLPTQLGAMPALTSLSFKEVPNLTGSIPTQLGLLSSSTATVIFQNCDLQGTLPSELASVWHLELAGNRLSGTVPEGMRSLWVVLADNAFTGTLPSVPDSVAAYDVSDNEFSGTIPSDLGPRLHNVTGVGLHNNRLTGELPSQIAAMTSVLELHVHSNGLFGSLPTQVACMAKLTSLRVDQNRFSGTLPSELGLLGNLTELDVGDNALGGAVPSQLALLTRLTSLNISHNAFTGSLPRQLGLLTALTRVSVENNRLQGDAPSEAWVQECDNSGLDDRACQYDCPHCKAGAVELLVCDWRGRGQLCVSRVVLGIVFAAVLVCVVATFKSVNGSMSRMQLAKKTATMMYAVVETFLDLLFALRSGGLVGAVALVGFGIGRVVGALIGAATLVRWQRRWWQAVLGASMCSASPTALRGLLPLEVQTKSRTVRRWIVVVTLTECSVEGSLQAFSFANGQRDSVTVLSLMLSIATFVSTVTVLAVFGLANYHTAKAQAAAEAEANEGKPSAPRDGERRGSGSEIARNGCNRACRRVSRLLVCTTCCLVALVVLGTNGPSSQSTVLSAQSGGAQLASAPLRPEEQQRFRTVRAAVDNRNGLARPKVDLDCPADGVFREPIVCFGGQIVLIADTSGLFSDDEAKFSEVMQETGVRLLHFGFLELPIPPTIQQMTSLALVALYRFVGPLPTEIGLLGNLQFLALLFATSGTDLIPSEIGNLSSLELCFAQDLVGTVPSQIGRVSTLQSLSVERARPPTAWSLPTQLGMLGLLDGITVTDSNVEGPLPSQLGRLGATLAFLDLSDNALSGAIPSELALLSLLEWVSFSGSALQGTMPDFLSLPELKHCEAGDQGLQGSLPASIPAGSLLTFVELGGNDLRGTIPSQLGQATALTHLSLYGNSFAGTVPTQLGLLTLLTLLSLHSLGIGGLLPSQLGRLSRLEVLLVHNNLLGGTIPSQLALLTLLADVGLSDNGFEGRLGSAFGDSARDVWLEDCDLSGVDDARCARTCPDCGFGAVRVRGCDGRGFGGVCAPPWLVLLGAALVAGAMRFVVRQVSAQQLGKVETAAVMVLSLVAAMHVLLDVLFALLAPTVIAGCSFGVIVVAVFARFVLATGEFFRTQLLKHAAAQPPQPTHASHQMGDQQRKGLGPRQGGSGMSVWGSELLARDDVRRAALDTKLFAAALILCILDPSALFHVFHTTTEKASVEAALRAKVLGAKLVADLPHVVLQAAVIGTKAANANARQALTLTVLSIVLGVIEWTVRHNQSKARVSSVPPGAIVDVVELQPRALYPKGSGAGVGKQEEAGQGEGGAEDDQKAHTNPHDN